MCFEANGLSVYSSFFSISVRNLTRYTEGWNLPKNGYNLLKLSFYEIIYCIRAGYLAIPLYCTFYKILSPLCTIRYGSAHSRVFWCLHRLVVGGGSDLSSSDITKVILPKIMLYVSKSRKNTWLLFWESQLQIVFLDYIHISKNISHNSSINKPGNIYNFDTLWCEAIKKEDDENIVFYFHLAIAMDIQCYKIQYIT